MLTRNEQDFLNHMNRWGSDGYPMRKYGRVWLWDELYGIKGAPIPYKTKKAGHAAIERYIAILCDKKAGRL